MPLSREIRFTRTSSQVEIKVVPSGLEIREWSGHMGDDGHFVRETLWNLSAVELSLGDLQLLSRWLEVFLKSSDTAQIVDVTRKIDNLRAILDLIDTREAQLSDE